jgi:hypothetical protein
MTTWEHVTEPIECVIKIDSEGKQWSVPLDPANSDYQAYLKWLEEQNG